MACKHAQTHAITQPLTPPLITPTHQVQLESISKALRIPGSKSLGPVAKAIRKSQDILKKQRSKIEADFVPEKRVGLLAVLCVFVVSMGVRLSHLVGGIA